MPILSATQRLADVLELHREKLPQFGWPSEAQRWKELLVCLIHQTRQVGAISEVRNVLAIWEALDLIAPDKLLGVGERTNEEAFLLFTLKRHSFSDLEARSALDLARRAAEAISKNYEGKVQLLLRKHATNLRDEAVNILSNAGLSEDKTRFAITHWLQNTTNAPLSLENASVRAFCQENEIENSALVRAADELDINLALVDDLLDLLVKDTVTAGAKQ
jgi:hypothetical protein